MTKSPAGRLIEVRKSTGLTQALFAKSLKLSRTAYVNYEHGDRELPSSVVLEIENQLSIEPTWLLTGRGARTAEIHNENIKIASSAVRQFALAQDLNIEPEREARLVLLIVKHLDAVEDIAMPEIKMMLENAS